MNMIRYLLLPILFVAAFSTGHSQVLVPVGDEPSTAGTSDLFGEVIDAPESLVPDAGDCFICDEEVRVSIFGRSSVHVGDEDTYYVSVSGGGSHTSTIYNVLKGSIQTQSKTSVRIRWTSAGSGYVSGSAIISGNYYAFEQNVTVTASTPPARPPSPAVSSNTCGNKTLTCATPPSGVAYYWQTSSSGTSTGNSSSTYVVTSSRTVYLRARNSAGIWSSSRSIAVTVNPVPGTPAAPEITENSCGTAVLSRGTPPAGVTWYWQTVSSGTSTANSDATFAVNTDGTIYLRARNNASGCWGSQREVYVDVDEAPEMTAGVAKVLEGCGVTEVTLRISGARLSVTYYWQETPEGTSKDQPAYEDNFFDTSGTYYLRAVKSGDCWSPSSVAYEVNVLPLPPAPELPVAQYVREGGMALVRSEPPAGYIWYWQGTAPEGTASTDAGERYRATVSGTYYLRTLKADDDDCWGPSVAVPVALQAEVPQEVVEKAREQHSITIRWSAAGNETAFLVSRATNASGPYEVLQTLDGAARQFADLHVQPGTTYYYRLQSIVDKEYSLPSQVLESRTRDLPGVDAPQQALMYNGNISAMVWNSGAGQKMYTFQYDAMNRLTKAHYAERSPQNNWSNGAGHFQLYGVDYDLNGNIKALSRNGLHEQKAQVIDELSYIYKGNQLHYVEDAANWSGFKNGHPGSMESPDYAYDANGNLVLDRNKDIASITYNHLNLPEVVTKTDGSSLKYYYDASGVKQSQEVYDANGTLVKQLDYFGDFIFEDGEMQQIHHDEGRVVFDKTRNSYEYHFKIADHLGNTRVMFTTSPKEIDFTLNYESSESNPDDEAVFTELDNIVEANIHDHTDAGATYQKSQRLTGGANAAIGSVLTIPVGAGDKVSASVYAKYLTATGGSNPSLAIGNLLAAAITGTTGADTYEGAITSSYGSSGSMITNVFENEISSNEPMAFINLLYLPDDAGSSIDDSYFAFKQISSSSGNAYALLELDEPFEAPGPGYVVVYLSNESEVLQEVYFDDLEVHVIESELIEKQDFFPFGLTFNTYDRVTAESNRYKFNQGTGDKVFNTERIVDLDLNLDMTKYRMYDYATGRFTSIDPLAEVNPQESWTPYQYGFNNPISFNDPYGDCPNCLTAGIGAGIGFVGGFFGGLIAGKSVKESLAIGAGGAVVGAFIGSGAGVITALGGATSIGTANSAYIIGGSAILGGAGGNLAEQGVKNLLGVQKGFNKSDFTLSMSLSIPEAMMGPIDDLAKGTIKSTLKDKITKEFAKDLSFRAQNKLVKQLRKDLKVVAKQHGVKLTNKQAKLASQKIANAANESSSKVMNATIKVSNKAVDVTLVGVGNMRSETIKESLKDD